MKNVSHSEQFWPFFSLFWPRFADHRAKFGARSALKVPWYVATFWAMHTRSEVSFKWPLTTLFTNMRTLKFKSCLHNCVFRCRQSLRSQATNLETCTNDKSHTWPFEPAEVKFCFLRGPLRWLMAAKNVTINLNFMIRMFLKSAVIQVPLQVVCRFVENMASHLLTKYITWCTSCQAVLFHGKITCLVPRPHYWARPMSFGSRGLSELSRIRHRNALVEKAWEEAVQGLGKVKYYHWSYNHEAFALEKKL